MTRDEIMLKLLWHGPMNRDAIVQCVGWGEGDTLDVLDALHKAGRLDRHPGNGRPVYSLPPGEDPYGIRRIQTGACKRDGRSPTIGEPLEERAGDGFREHPSAGIPAGDGGPAKARSGRIAGRGAR